MSKKIIIIGAGLGGLISGLMAKKAQPDDEVIIYELNKIPGGLCTAFKKAATYNNEKITYTINIPLIASDFQDDETFGEFFKYLGIKNINWRVLQNLFMYYPEKGKPFVFDQHGGENLINLATSKKEKKALQKFFKHINKIYNQLFHKGRVQPTPLQAIKMLLTIPTTVFAMMFDKPYLKVIEKIGIQTEMIKNILCVPEAFMGVDVDKVSAFGEMVMIQSFLNKCALQPDKGDNFQMLSDNIAARFTEMGGIINYRTKVDHVTFDKKQATGVMINGEQITADAVLLAVAQDRIEHLIKEGTHIGPIRKQIKQCQDLPYPNSDYYCFYLIDRKAVDENPHMTDFGYHIYKLPEGRDPSNWKLALWIPNELINNKYYVLAVVMTEQNQEKVEWWLDLRDRDYKQYEAEKEKMAMEFQKQIQEVEPIFQKYPPLKHLITMSPGSYLPYGTIFPISGLAQTPKNFGMYRMTPKILDNLFITSGANFSGGLFGAMAGGWQGFLSYYRSVYKTEVGNHDIFYSKDLKNLP